MNNALICSSSRWRSLLALIVAIPGVTTLFAANYVWDPANTGNGATIDAGSGTWDLSGTNTVWNDSVTNLAWAQTSATSALHSAQFAGVDAPAGTSYTITMGASVAVNTTNNALRFSNNGYVLTAPQGSNYVITSRQLTTDAGKTVTLSGPITLSLTNTTGVNQINGLGTVVAKDGAKITPAGNPTFSIGSKLRLQAGSVYTSGGSVIVGGQGSDGSTTELTVEGGSLNIAGSSIALILANVNSTTAQFSNTVVTLSSGSITNSSAGGGIRFGGSAGTAANNSNVNGTFNLDGGVLTTGRIYESNGTVATAYNSTFNFNGGMLKALATTANGATFMETLNTANVKAGGALIDTNGANITIGQALVADPVSTGGGLTKLGAGTLTLTGANTYTGTTLVSAGNLAFTAPYSALSATTVATSARLQINSGATASTLPALTLQGGAGVQLNLGVYNAATLSTAAFAAIDAAGDYLIDLSGTNIPVGTYTVFSYGTKTGAGVASLGLLPPGVTATLQDTGSSIVLNVLTPQLNNYVWSVGTGDWDTSTVNWTGQSYAEGSVVTFPNLPGANTVNLPAVRTPFSVAIQNNYNATPASNSTYTFTGSAIGGSAAVTKTGTGVATFASSNSYSGTTAVNAGVLLVSADAALGLSTGATTIASGASLGLSGGLSYTPGEPLVLSGSGYDTTIDASTFIRLRGAIQSLSGNSAFAGPITLGAGATRFGAQNGASLTLSGTITPAAGVSDSTVYFRAGDNAGDFITLSGANNQWNLTASLYTNCSSGTAGVRLGANNALPTTASVVAGGTFAGTGNTLDLNGFNQTLPGLVNSDGNLQIANLKAGTTSVLTLDTSAADFTSEASPSNTENEFTIIADGNGIVALTKKGAFKQTLAGIQAYSGPTTIEAGTLALVGAGFLQATPVTLLAGSTLDVAGVTATGFALSGGLSGSGTLTATGKTVTVSSVFEPVALAVTGNLSLAAGTATTLVAAATPEATSAVTVAGALVLNGTLAITEAAGFDFATGQSITFATGAITPGLTGVNVSGVALTESAPDVWTGSIAGLNCTFTEATATLAVSGGAVITPLQTWRNTYFPAAGNDGTGIGANSADPDADGIANLVEYATHTSPISANGSPVVQGTSAGRLSLTFPRIDDPALRYTVESRDDLVSGAWVAITPAAANNPSFGFTGTISGVTETVSETVIDSVLIASQPKRFLRLSVDFTQSP